MSSRTGRKQEAKAARFEAEPGAARRRRLQRLGAVAVLAVALVAAAIALT